MDIIYEENEMDFVIEEGGLNGRDGAIFVTDHNDEIDITFENMATAKAWSKALRKALKEFEEQA